MPESSVLPTHLGVTPPVLGSHAVTEILTDKVKGLTGGYSIVDLDPVSAADKLLAAIDERRHKACRVYSVSVDILHNLTH